MRKKLLFLSLSLTVMAAALAAPRSAEANVACPICTTYADGSQCCVSCVCDNKGHVLACTNHYCPPEGGGA
jgi:hypothetical protein